MCEREEIARRILMLEGELNFCLDIGNLRQAAVLRRQKTTLADSLRKLEFWQQQQDDERRIATADFGKA